MKFIEDALLPKKLSDFIKSKGYDFIHLFEKHHVIEVNKKNIIIHI